MKTKTEKILIVLTILSYLALVGFSIECGSRIVSLLISFKNPELASKFYMVDNSWWRLARYNDWYFPLMMSILILISALKVAIWWSIIELLSKLNLRNPFTPEVARKLERIGYQLLSVWVVGVIGNMIVEWISKKTGEAFGQTGVADEFFFIAGIVYIISQVFRRGIELQEENQLTV